MGSENLNNGSSTADRFGGVGPYRQGRRDAPLPGDPVDADLAPRNGSAPTLDPAMGLERPPTLPSLDMGGLSEPVFPPPGWLAELARAKRVLARPRPA